jgi:hypothetical protein
MQSIDDRRVIETERYAAQVRDAPDPIACDAVA